MELIISYEDLLKLARLECEDKARVLMRMEPLGISFICPLCHKELKRTKYISIAIVALMNHIRKTHGIVPKIKKRRVSTKLLIDLKQLILKELKEHNIYMNQSTSTNTSRYIRPSPR